MKDKCLLVVDEASQQKILRILEILQERISKSESREYPVFSTSELAAKLRVTSRTIQNWRDQGKIGFVQTGNVILYKQEHIEDFLSKHERRSHV